MSALTELKFEPMYVLQAEGREGGLFQAHKGKRLITADRRAGKTPFVAGSRMNNSITDFADTPALFPGGWVTLIYNGDGGTGHAKYQPAPFSASDDVIALEPLSVEASEASLLFIACLLTHQCVPKFGFGYKLTLHRLSRQKILVPVTTDAYGIRTVDWAGMSRFGEELFVEAHSQARAARWTCPIDDEELPNLKFEPRPIMDVFETMHAAGKWLDHNKAVLHGEPSVPYVTRSGVGNGVGAFLPHQSFDAPNDGNAISIGVSTSTVFYQPVAFYTSKEIQVLRHPNLSVNNGPVLVAIIRAQMSKFQWGNGASLVRLKATRIMVPVSTDIDGKSIVDWDGMSRYGRVLRGQAERSLDTVLSTILEAVAA
ncbi:restriction endonuclease subunit S [Arthrobacter glacialis]|uniref:Type I restriction modification DNA specificity domain-containing protein n=1 Tax=Arthrobacter glacialis TaxID=1664 RepID=A0A2S4A1W1_ARTGL|nr:restriction endonuclease subunit S [Arthrobacter glacialis]POH75172.1 hypothetical protein CVS27_00740 [Arthrobacter glacialis]